MKLLDLFCGAGGAAMGYHRAGFDEIVGVDLKAQPRYPFTFVQGDALEYAAAHAHEFDAIHASPPCQAYSLMRRGRWKDREHPELIGPVRDLLKKSGKPYVIENVTGARHELIDPVMLCGTMFGLGTKEGNQLRRHRYFELSFAAPLTAPCAHNAASAIGVYGVGQHPDRRKALMIPACNHNGYSAVPVYGGGQDKDYHKPPRKPKTIGVYGNAGGSSKRDGVTMFGQDARREAMGIDWMKGKELSEAIPPAYTQFIGEHLLQAIRERVSP